VEKININCIKDEEPRISRHTVAYFKESFLNSPEKTKDYRKKLHT
jgi:hypothetical protein